MAKNLTAAIKDADDLETIEEQIAALVARKQEMARAQVKPLREAAQVAWDAFTKAAKRYEDAAGEKFSPHVEVTKEEVGKVVGALGSEPLKMSEISTKTGLDMAKVRTILADLKVSGKAKQQEARGPYGGPWTKP